MLRFEVDVDEWSGSTHDFLRLGLS